MIPTVSEHPLNARHPPPATHRYLKGLRPHRDGLQEAHL